MNHGFLSRNPLITSKSKSISRQMSVAHLDVERAYRRLTQYRCCRAERRICFALGYATSAKLLLSSVGLRGDAHSPSPNGVSHTCP